MIGEYESTTKLVLVPALTRTLVGGLLTRAAATTAER